MKCDIKDSAEAYNTGIEALERAFMMTGNATKAFRYAISEIQSKHPEFDFEVSSFVDPILSGMKENGLVDKSYEFGKKSEKSDKEKVDRIKKLASDIANLKTKKVSEKKESDLTDDEKKIRAFVSSKYGKLLNKEDLNSLLNEAVNGEKVSDIIAYQMQEEEDIKEAQREQKQIEKDAEKQRKKDSSDYDKMITRQFSQDRNEELKKQKQIEKDKLKIQKIVEKFSNLDQDQKKSLAKKMYEKFEKDGTITNDQVQNLYSEAVGIPAMSDEIKSLIKESSSAMKDYDKADADIKSLYNEIDNLKKNQEGKISEDQDKELISRIKQLAIKQQEAKVKANRAQTKLAQELREKSFWMWDLADNMRMNLMTPVSLLKNLTGAGVDLLIRQPKNAVSGMLSTMINPFTAKKYGTRSGRIGSRFLGGLMNADKSFKNSMENWGYGRTEFDRSLPKSDYLNAVTAYKKMIDSSGKQKIINAVAFALKVTPDFVKRTLGATDAFFYDNAVRSELERIATQKGLSGSEKALFMLEPDEKSLEEATKLAEEVTFRTDTKLSKKLSYDPREHYKTLVKNGDSPSIAKLKTGLASIGTVLVAPFIKTPVNILRLASRYALPEWEMGRAVNQAIKAKTGNERQQIIVDGIAHAAVGYYIRSVAVQAIAAGAITSGFGDEDRKTLDVIEQQLGGANRANWSAILRIMTGGDGKWQKGDKTVDLNSLGVFGVVLATYARSYGSYSEEDKKEQSKFANTMRPSIAPVLSLAGSALDLSFLSGTNQVLEAFKSGQSKDKGIKLGINWLTTIFGGIEPSTFQKLSMSVEDSKKQSYDKDKEWNENLANILGYKFLFVGGKDMKNKYYSLASEGEAMKKKDYMLFDNYLGRVLQEEFGVFKSKEIIDGPIKKLLDTASKVEKESRDDMFPSSVDKKQTFGSGKNTVSVELTPEQHEFLMEKASEFRMISATPYINSPEFDKDTYEVKKETLSRLYKDGLDAAKNILIQKYGSELKSTDVKNDSDSAKINYKKYGKKKKRSK